MIGPNDINIDIKDNYYIEKNQNLSSAQRMTNHPNIVKAKNNINFPWSTKEDHSILKLAAKNS